MNYSTDIKFSNNLVKKGKTTITYSGSLFRTGSESVTIVYGFGNNWENTTEKQMTKNENNFSVEIELLDFDKINFCFRNSDNIWDNNNYLNYIAPISEPEENYNFIINENIIGGMLNNLFETDLSTCEKEEISTSEIDAIELQDKVEITPIELVENSVVSEETLDINIPENNPACIQEFIGETTVETSLTKDLEYAFAELFEDTQEEKKDQIVNFDMDSIIDDILSPIIEAKKDELQDYHASVNLAEEGLESDIFAELFEQDSDTNVITQEENYNVNEISTDDTIEESLLEDFSKESENQETSLVEVKNKDENTFLVSPRSLGKFYMFRKRIKLAIYKFFTAIPKIIESSFNEEKN